MNFGLLDEFGNPDGKEQSKKFFSTLKRELKESQKINHFHHEPTQCQFELPTAAKFTFHIWIMQAKRK